MKQFAIAGLVTVAAVAASARAERPNFSDTWLLGTTQSRGLPANVTKGERYTWTDVQTDATITVSDSIAGGPRPGGGSIGTYTLDGREATSGSGPQEATVALKASWSDSNLQLFRERIVNTPNPVTTNAPRTLALSADGRTLTVTFHYESPRGSSDQTMVFAKQGSI